MPAVLRRRDAYAPKTPLRMTTRVTVHQTIAIQDEKMREVAWILQSSTRYGRNFAKEQWNHSRSNVYVAAVFATLFGGGLFVFFVVLFHSVERLEALGDLLLNRLLSMFLLATFSMLIFSNLVISLTTLYRSEDIEFLMVQPIRRTAIFWAKFVDCLFYSSWPFVFLFGPLFLAYGLTRGFPFYFYPSAVLAFVLFLIIAAACGQVLMLLLAGLLPARRGLWASIGAAVIFISLMAFRVLGGGMMLQAYRRLDFEAILASLRVGGTPWLPSHWASQAMLSVAEGDWSEFFFRVLLLLANVALALEVLSRLSERLFYRAWAQAREGVGRARKENSRASNSFQFARITTLFLSKPLRALAVKDFLSFFRDPWQWTQFAMLLGLLTIYLFNLRSTPLAELIPFWKHLVTFFNLGATAFIFAILTTRFVYPLLSLEGGEAWMWGLSPLPRKSMVWQKFFFTWFWGFFFSLILLCGTSILLKVSGLMFFLSAFTLTLLSLGLSSLAVGMGAIYPNFQTDNAAKIANGIGGVVTVALSLTYVIVAILIEVIPTYWIVSQGVRSGAGLWAIVITAVLLGLVLHFVAIFLPLRIGLRKWSAQEF